ncbi:MAG: Uma2 family endonuclease [Hyphomicrobiaceae bacterium]
MNSAAPKLPPLMTVEEFLAWPGDGSGRIYELVEGELRAQDAARDTHGTIHAHLARIIGNHIEAARPNCRVVAAPGLQPNLRATWNYRIPEIAVTCTANRADVHKTPDPLLVIEVLSPSNVRDTWSNIPLFASLPSVMEILVVDSTEVIAHLLRRKADGSWPENPTVIESGAVHLTSIDLALTLTDIYRGTHLAIAT